MKKNLQFEERERSYCNLLKQTKLFAIANTHNLHTQQRRREICIQEQGSNDSDHCLRLLFYDSNGYNTKPTLILLML